jgi:hypothetical protein
MQARKSYTAPTAIEFFGLAHIEIAIYREKKSNRITCFLLHTHLLLRRSLESSEVDFVLNYRVQYIDISAAVGLSQNG